MTTRALLALAAAIVGVTGCPSDHEHDGAQVQITEIMYHPVLEDGPLDEHEFIELQNTGTRAVDLGGFRLSGGVRFTFAAGTRMEPGAFLVVAKRRERLLQVARYALSPPQVVGDYASELGNDGDTVRIERTRNGKVEVLSEVSYDDAFPWPLAADALGGGEAWLAPPNLPLESHRYLGRSLERLSTLYAGNIAPNWVASPLDGATPGRPRAEAATGSTPLRPTVVEIATAAAGKRAAVLPPGVPIEVPVRITPLPNLATFEPAIEYFADDPNKEDEAKVRAPLAPDAGSLKATLPAFPAGTLLRYRVVANLGAGVVPISPRAEEPFAWHNAFVSDPVPGRTPVYHLLIGKARWASLWDNIIDGRVPANVGGGNPQQCEINPRWDARVPAVLVAGGQVLDIQARFQGSRTNRLNGPRPFDRMKWPGASGAPSQLETPLSWHFNFPRHARYEGKRSFNLSKLPDQSCQGFFARVGNTLFEMAGIPAAESSYARLYINGVYYHYMQRLEHVDEELLLRHFGPDHDVGDLFKSVGARWDEGPFGFGDEGLLKEYCGYSIDERYAATYKRQTHDDDRPGSREVRKLLEDLHAARAGGTAAVRAFFEAHFDMAALTNYMVVRNWLGAWDDVWQNHYLYRKADGRWMVLPTDLDVHFGFAPPSAIDASFFSGVDNGRSNFRDLTNYLKDSYLRAFREEFLARVGALSATILHPTNVLPIIDEALAMYDVEEARAAPAGITMNPLCGAGDPRITAARMKDFVIARTERVLSGLFD